MKDHNVTNGSTAGESKNIIEMVSQANDGTLDSEVQSPVTSTPSRENWNDFKKTLAGIIGNVLEWYDFAVFGFLSDIIGQVFFPAHQSKHNAITESFLVFGGAFLMRPVGGVCLGYIGDKYGHRRALMISIFLMAFPTFAMGCLPSYEHAGDISIYLLVIVRLLQGFSVGGQLMSSAVFTLENHERKHWGYYGALVMAAANFGTLLGSFVGWSLRSSMSEEKLIQWGWRIPFWSGIVVSFSGFYLRDHHHDGEKEQRDKQNMAETKHSGDGMTTTPPPSENPVRLAFAKHNLRSLCASALVPMLWSAGFYLSFVWMAIYMSDLIDPNIKGAFGVNAGALFISVCLFFPYAGVLSDKYGRRPVMTIGGFAMGVVSPFLILLIGKGKSWLALFAQTLIGICLSLWGAPMVAWLVESFEPEARLTSVAIGYNIAQALVGGLTPALATFMVDSVGSESPGIILTALAVVGLIGLWLVAPPPETYHKFEPTFVSGSEEEGEEEDPQAGSIELKRPTKIPSISNGYGPHNIFQRRQYDIFAALPFSDDHDDDNRSLDSQENELL